jgi:hypothetical protein
MMPVSITTSAASLTPAAEASASPLSQIAASVLLSSELESRTSESIGKITAGGAGGVSPLDLLETQLNVNELSLQTNILNSLISGTKNPLEDIANKII